MRNRKILFLLFGIFLAAIGFAHSRVCIAATQTNSHQQISEDYLSDAIANGDIRIVRAALNQNKHLDMTRVLINGSTAILMERTNSFHLMKKWTAV
jgi:hypothetical protein